MKEEREKKTGETKALLEQLDAKEAMQKENEEGAQYKETDDKLANDEGAFVIQELDGTDRIIARLFRKWTYLDAPLAVGQEANS